MDTMDITHKKIISRDKQITSEIRQQSDMKNDLKKHLLKQIDIGRDEVRNWNAFLRTGILV